MNFSSLTTPNIFAFNLGNLFVSSFNFILLIGHLSSTKISKSLMLFLANGTLSLEPGDSNFLWIDFAISISGDITKSIGKFSLLNSWENFGSRYSWDLILAIFLGILNKEYAIWQISILISSFLVTAMIIFASDILAFSRTAGEVALPTIALTSNVSFIFWISSLDWSITVIEWFCSLSNLAIVKPTLPAPHIIIFI